MNRLKIIHTVVLLLICGYVFSQTEHSDKNVKIKVPTEWINKLRNYDYKQSSLILLKEFEGFTMSNSIAGSKEFTNNDDGVLNPMFVNLDNDKNDELIGLFGRSEEEPILAVFKMIGEDWYLIYLEPFYMFYTSPELQVANNFSANKTFYIRWLHERGSGIYADGYHFYKLINNKVYPCLHLINEAHILGWGLYLNQDIETSFKFNSAKDDELWVTYKYNFFPGAVSDSDAPWDSHEEISFVKGKDGLSYSWDTTTFTYKPQFYTYDKKKLSELKISSFGVFGDDRLFVRAFDYEINQTLTKGTVEQKKVLQKYLDIVKAEGHAVSPTGKVEEKGQVSKLKFYGAKAKKKKKNGTQ